MGSRELPCAVRSKNRFGLIEYALPIWIARLNVQLLNGKPDDIFKRHATGWNMAIDEIVACTSCVIPYVQMRLEAAIPAAMVVPVYDSLVCPTAPDDAEVGSCRDSEVVRIYDLKLLICLQKQDFISSSKPQKRPGSR
jgi:hypothetical protein